MLFCWFIVQNRPYFFFKFDRSFEFNLYDEKLMRLETLPPPGVVFLVDFGSDGLHRVVCNVRNN